MGELTAQEEGCEGGRLTGLPAGEGDWSAVRHRARDMLTPSALAIKRRAQERYAAASASLSAADDAATNLSALRMRAHEEARRELTNAHPELRAAYETAQAAIDALTAVLGKAAP